MSNLGINTPDSSILPPLSARDTSRDSSRGFERSGGSTKNLPSVVVPVAHEKVRSRDSGFNVQSARAESPPNDSEREDPRGPVLDRLIVHDGRQMSLRDAMMHRPTGIYLEMIKNSLDLSPATVVRSGSQSARRASEDGPREFDLKARAREVHSPRGSLSGSPSPRRSYLRCFEANSHGNETPRSGHSGLASGGDSGHASGSASRQRSAEKRPGRAGRGSWGSDDGGRGVAVGVSGKGGRDDSPTTQRLAIRPPDPSPPQRSWVSSCKKGYQLAYRGPPAGERGHQQLTPAAKCFLDGLTRAPHNSKLLDGFETQVHEFKTEQIARWAKWPFHIPPAPRPTARAKRQKLVAPDSMYGSLRGVGATATTVEVEWDAHELRHEDDRIDGYELEAAEISHLDGQGPFKFQYKGDRRRFTLTALLPESEVVVRVRAYNRRGEGEWSDEVVLNTTEEEETELVEIAEIPPAWRTLDLGDLCKDDPAGSPEAIMEELIGTMTTHQKEIKIAFRYFTLMGGSNSTEEMCDAMGQQQFVQMAKTAKLLDKKLVTSDCDRIFLRAIRATEAVVEAFGAVAKAAAKLAGKVQAKASSLMHQHQFCAGLVRLAAAKWPSMPSNAARLDRLCVEHLHDMVYKELQLVSDDFSDQIGSALFKAVLRKHEEKMSIIFNYYAGADNSLAAQTAGNTMNIKETGEMCEDAGFFDDVFGVRDLVAAFVKVNIDDELYVQEDEDNTASELVFDEFQEIVARMFNEREWSRPERPLPDGRERAETLELGFDDWLETYFVPKGLSAIKMRKKANK